MFDLFYLGCKGYFIKSCYILQIEKKVKSSSIDLRVDADRRRKEHRKERGDSKCSRESSDSRKREKAQKEHKELKVFKDDK